MRGVQVAPSVELGAEVLRLEPAVTKIPFPLASAFQLALLGKVLAVHVDPSPIGILAAVVSEIAVSDFAQKLSDAKPIIKI